MFPLITKIYLLIRDAFPIIIRLQICCHVLFEQGQHSFSDLLDAASYNHRSFLGGGVVLAYIRAGCVGIVGIRQANGQPYLQNLPKVEVFSIEVTD